MKKTKKRKSKRSKIPELATTSREAKEKIFVLLFLVFVIVAIMVLFEAPITSRVVLGPELDKAVFGASDYLEGEITLQLQEGDLLPSIMTVNLLISTDALPQQTEYVCPIGNTVTVLDANGTLLTADPESQCCLLDSRNCIQLIRDSGFEESFNIHRSLGLIWVPIPSDAQTQLDAGVSEDTVGGVLTSLAWLDSSHGEDVSIWQTFREVDLGGTVITGHVTDTGTGIDESTEGEEECTDTDGGYNPSVKGTCTDATGLTFLDTCTDDGKLIEYQCSSLTGVAGSLKCESTIVNCPEDYTCQSGACIRAAGTCTDTDGGYNPSVKGTCTDLNGFSFTDKCTTPNQQGDLIEYQCSQDNTCRPSFVDCLEGSTCQDDVCAEGAVETCTDSDGGYDIFVKGTCTTPNSAPLTDTCTQDGKLIEYQCLLGGDLGSGEGILECVSSIVECPQDYTCQNGACAVVAGTCKDTDLGSIYVKGTCTDNTGSFTDRCSAENTVVEYNCVDTDTPQGIDQCVSSPTICPQGYTCQDGACVVGRVETCTDTDGGNIYKKGICSVIDRHPIFIDYCKADGKLVEYKCSQQGDVCIEEIIDCPRGYTCEDYATGACVAVEQNMIISWWLRYNTYAIYDACAFEVVVIGKSGGQERNLHYYFEGNSIVDGCKKPDDGTNDKYIDMTSYFPSLGDWQNYSRDLTQDWKSVGWSESDNTISKIKLVSHGQISAYSDYYGQRVYWDDIRIMTAPEPSLQCEARGKKCCLSGSGLGNYYGSQLNCSQGYECWDSCADSARLTLSDFILRSDDNDKVNRKSGYYTCMGCTDLQCSGTHLCGSDFDHGLGYAPCTDFTKAPCSSWSGWDNTYSLDISKISNINNQRLRAPSENGTYYLTLQLRYKPWAYLEEESIVYETAIPFTVGGIGLPPCTSNWVNCTNQSICDSTTGYEEIIRTVCVDENLCGVTCPTDICAVWYTGNTCSPALPACIEYDYDYSDWYPEVCPYQGEQTRTYTLIGAGMCDPTLQGSWDPELEAELEQDCTQDIILEYIQAHESDGRDVIISRLKSAGWPSSDINYACNVVYGKPKVSWGIWILIIVLLFAAAIVVIVFKVIKGGKPGKKKIPPELISYIRDALATGAPRPEIKTRLIGAGWPPKAVEAAFKVVH